MKPSRTWLVVAVALTALFAGLLVARQRPSPNAPGAPAEALLTHTFKDLHGKPRAMSEWQGQLVYFDELGRAIAGPNGAAPARATWTAACGSGSASATRPPTPSRPCCWIS